MKNQEDEPGIVVGTADRSEEIEGESEEKTSVSPPQEEAAISLEELPEISEEAPVKRPFWSVWSSLSRDQLLTAIAFCGVILLGAILRFWGLGDRPLHHDESLHGYFSLQLLHNNIEQWLSCFKYPGNCYHYDPLTHGPFQFHAIAIVYLIAQLLHAPDNGVNTTTVRIAAALLGTMIVALPYFLRHHLGNVGAWLACFLLAISPSMVYFSRFAREDIYMACFTLLMVVAVAQYLRTHSLLWFITAAAAFSLSYATKEATFLTIGIFGSFFGALIAWELGSRWSFPLQFHSKGFAAKENGVETSPQKSFASRKAAPVALLVYFIVAGIFAKWLFGWVKNLSIYITDPRNTSLANAFVSQLKDNTQHVIPWLGMALAVIVMIVLFREKNEENVELREQRGLAKWVDPKKQPLLCTIVTMAWQHLFFGFVIAWTLFFILFTALFTNIPKGIGDGIWQGLYYWIQQQQVARGGQPWYYYIMLIPLYEQIGLVFGFVGIVYCLRHPSRFRLFLVYWFVGNIFIYSWAAEKMPWLMIHITMPLMLLAAIGLQPIVLNLKDALTRFRTTSGVSVQNQEKESALAEERVQTRFGGYVPRFSASIFGAVIAVFTLILTLQNMLQVVYIHPADATHEMMIYVQTTPDINTVMAKVDQLDQKLYGGKHLMPIAMTSDATWPFAWYLRDYPNVCFMSPGKACPTSVQWPVIIAGGDNLSEGGAVPSVYDQYSQEYAYHQYVMRSQWDQGYMPPPCVSTPTNPCAPQAYTGVGPLPWLSYGNNPPHLGQFNLGLIAKNVWQWWWHRTPFGGIDSGYGMALLIQKDVSARSGIRP